jgi:hypothetical protein
LSICSDVEAIEVERAEASADAVVSASLLARSSLAVVASTEALLRITPTLLRKFSQQRVDAAADAADRVLVIDEERGRVVFYVQNRRDHPGRPGQVFDFPGVSIIEYAGGGRWKREEDYWAVKGRETAMAAYEAARREFDPEHPAKGTRWNWNAGPDWTKGAVSYAERITLGR